MVEFGDGLREATVGFRIVEGTGDEAQSGAQLVPRALVKSGAGVRLDGRAHVFLEILRAPVAARKAGQRKRGVEETSVGEIVDRGEQLLAGEVTGDTEDDKAAGR